jgi:hypothetical protein
MNFGGIIARLLKQPTNTDGVPVRLSNYASMSVAQVESPYLELTRMARRFHGGLQILANAIAPVQVIPTTTAALALYNNDTRGNGMSICLDWLNTFLASGTPAAGKTIMIAIGKPTTPPTVNATGYGIGSLNASLQGSVGILTTGLTFPAGVQWTALDADFQPAGANVGQGDNPLDLGGRIIIPPGFALGIAVLSGAGTSPLYGVSLQWGELELDLA